MHVQAPFPLLAAVGEAREKGAKEVREALAGRCAQVRVVTFHVSSLTLSAPSPFLISLSLRSLVCAPSLCAALSRASLLR